MCQSKGNIGLIRKCTEGWFSCYHMWRYSWTILWSLRVI